MSNEPASHPESRSGPGRPSRINDIEMDLHLDAMTPAQQSKLKRQVSFPKDPSFRWIKLPVGYIELVPGVQVSTSRIANALEIRKVPLPAETQAPSPVCHCNSQDLSKNPALQQLIQHTAKETVAATIKLLAPPPPVPQPVPIVPAIPPSVTPVTVTMKAPLPPTLPPVKQAPVTPSPVPYSPKSTLITSKKPAPKTQRLVGVALCLPVMLISIICVWGFMEPQPSYIDLFIRDTTPGKAARIDHLFPGWPVAHQLLNFEGNLPSFAETPPTIRQSVVHLARVLSRSPAPLVPKFKFPPAANFNHVWLSEKADGRRLLVLSLKGNEGRVIFDSMLTSANMPLLQAAIIRGTGVMTCPDAGFTIHNLGYGDLLAIEESLDVSRRVSKQSD